MEQQTVYQLNMRLLSEAMERENIRLEFFDHEDSARYHGAGIFYDEEVLESGIVYAIRQEDWRPEFAERTDCGFVICGRIPIEEIPKQISSIQIPDSDQIFSVFRIMQQIFHLFDTWNRELYMARSSPRPLDEILSVSEKIFRNPMFIHDNYFYVLAHSEQLGDFGIWEQDKKTNQLVVRLNIRNDFQLDQEYLEGLSEKKSVLFSANQRGYQILYHNLYIDSRYVGRVLVDELRHSIAPGDYDVLEYLASFLQETIRMKGLTRGDYDGQLDQDIRRILNGEQTEKQNLFRMMDQKDWKQDDCYRCLKLIPDRSESYLVSNTVIIDRLHVLLPGCYTLLHEESAVVIINMSQSDSTIQEVVAGLAVFLRDSLMKLGISTEYRDFFLLPSAYKQATIALDQGKRSDSMYWYHYFESYMLEYAGDLLTGEMPAEMLVSEALNILKQYDKKNHTDLFETLKIYLRKERNLLQTAKKLYIHRSTLSYRIERIQAITGINLDDDKVRLRLLLSFELEEHSHL